MRTLFQLEKDLWLPSPLEEVFAFFSQARNLQTITPDWLSFEVLNEGEIPMHVGAEIRYRIRIHGIPVRWKTRISAWEPPFRFVDEQLTGPYRTWIHEHRFAAQDGGTRATDIVRYWPHGGRLMNWLFVRRDVERIFQYREQELRRIFTRPAPP
jgi:ligand-binding SRPBCC domain-containing protein